VTVSPTSPKRRRRDGLLQVRVHAEEAAAISAHARSVGMSVGAYLRAVGAGYEPRAVIDRDQVDAMLRINGDLGRLGGLLKLWLSDDAKLNVFDRGQVRQAILAALRRIDDNQVELRSAVRRVLHGGGGT
jgi:hypothetical protein